MKRKVTCVYGKWGKETDFVLEPVCNGEDCECCKDGFWIEKVEGDSQEFSGIKKEVSKLRGKY